MTAGHDAYAFRASTGWSRWSAVCPQGCRLDRAESREGAEHIADEHARATACHCYDVETREWAPTPCTNCTEKETA